MSNGFNFKQISEISRENHRKNGLISYVLFFFASLLSSGLILLNLLFSYLFIIIVPLLVIPIIFACQTAIMLLREQPTLTFKGFVKCYVLYFSELFSSNYRILRSLLFALIFYGGLLLTSFIVVIPTFYFTNYQGFAHLVNTISIESLYNVEYLDYVLNEYKLVLNTISICTVFPSISAFTFMFTYFISKNSYSHIYRINGIGKSGKVIGSIADLVRKNNKKLYLKCYWSLNWPIVALFIISFGLGAFVGYRYSINPFSMYTFALAIAVFISFTIYGPKYLANKQAIAEYLSPYYKMEENNMKMQFQNVLEELIKAREEETKKDSEES